MGWLDWFRRPNPTREWQREDRPLVINLAAATLEGIGLGDPFDGLRFLGPATVEGTEFAFAAHGLLIEADSEGAVGGFTVFTGHPDESANGRFTGVLSSRGHAWSVSPRTSEQESREVLGEPYWTDRDEDESILFYELDADSNGEPRIELQVEFGEDGGLKCVVVSRPLLADPEQRRRYGVDRAWPP